MSVTRTDDELLFASRARPSDPSDTTPADEMPVRERGTSVSLQPLGSSPRRNRRGGRGESDTDKVQKIRPRQAATTGWQARATDMVVSIGKPNWAPRPSSEELRQRRIDALTAEVWELVDQTQLFACAVLNRKGGAGKTPLTSYLSCLMANIIGGEISFYDGNPGSGASAQIMGMYAVEEDGSTPDWAHLTPTMPGMYRETVSVLMLRKILNQHQGEISAREFFNLVRQNHHGVSTVVAHQQARKDRDEYFSATMVQETLNPVINRSRLTFADTGNDATSKSQLAIADICSTFAPVAAVDKPASLNDLRQHIGILKDHGFGEKVDAATVVLLGIPPGESVENYRHHVGDHPGPVLGVPDDEQMKLCQPVALSKLRRDTKDALLEVLVSLLRQNLSTAKK